MNDLKDTVLNDVLCYISTARSSLSHDDIISNTLAFYKPESVTKAKELICKIAKEKYMVRKSCAAHPDPTSAHLKDIYDCFLKLERENITPPKFVAEGFYSFPPAGFQYLAPMVCALRDEIAALRIEVTEVRQSNQNDVRALNSANVVAQEVTEIKTLVQRVLHSFPSTPRPGNFRLDVEAVTTQVEPPADPHTAHSDPHTADSDNRMTQNATGNISTRDAVDGSNDGNWIIANNRPYANALRRNGLPLNPARRHSMIQRNGSNVPSARHNQRQRREVITGRRTSNSDFANDEPVVDIFLGGCKTTATTDVIEAYCTRNGVTLKKCEPLNSRNEWNKCFKLSVTLVDREKILDGGFWPCGVYVRKFYNQGRARTDA